MASAGLVGLLIGPFLVNITNRVLKEYEQEASSLEEASQLHHQPVPMFATMKWTTSKLLWALVTCILYVVSVVVIGVQYELVLMVFAIPVLVVLVQCDFRMMLLPNKVIVFGWLGVLVIRVVLFPSTVIWHVASSFIIGAAMLLIAMLGSRLLKQEALGGGDIKLFVLVGLLLGLELSFLTIIVASFIGLIFALIIRYSKRFKAQQYIPFGPFIAAACMTCFLWGEHWLTWYFSLL